MHRFCLHVQEQRYAARAHTHTNTYIHTYTDSASIHRLHVKEQGYAALSICGPLQTQTLPEIFCCDGQYFGFEQRCTQGMQVSMYLCMHVCIFGLVCMYLCIYACMYVFLVLYACMHVCMWVCTDSDPSRNILL